MKRIFDISVSFAGLVVLGPVILMFLFLVWRHDRHNPFYLPKRVGKDGKLFTMVKIRSMVINADKSGVDSTGAKDQRITKVGQLIRRYKIDELAQLWNVLVGDMSLVGPRPNVKRETDLYTPVETRLLSVKPGITDFASIVFSDEGEILADKPDPDIAYHQLIRPWKSRLGLFYIEHASVWLDLRLCAITVLAVIDRHSALTHVAALLIALNAEPALAEIAHRKTILQPCPPPGSSEIVMSRAVN